MSTPFYDLASLVLVPSGYKSQKVYAQKPLTTDGQLTFSRASTATRVNASGLIETVSSNVPRLDYLGSTCPKLQLEPSRTNLALYSSDFDNAHWVKYGGATVTANTVTSPDGTQNADTLNTASGQEIYATMGSKAASAITYTFSCFAKYNNAAVFQIAVSDFSTSGTTGNFNVQTGVATFAQGVTWSNTSVKMENYGNGWWRCILTSTSPTTTGLYVSLLTSTTGSVYIYGMQCEQASYVSSFIPTTSAAVTRLADACSKTGISSLIGQTEGTLFAEFEVNPLQDSLAIWTRNSATGLYGNMIYLGTNSSNQSRVQIVSGSVVQADIVGSTMTAGVHKFAVAYKNNDFAFYVDGVLVGTDTSGSVPVTMDELYIDSYIDGGTRPASKKQVLLFKTRLTNPQLAELTAL